MENVEVAYCTSIFHVCRLLVCYLTNFLRDYSGTEPLTISILGGIRFLAAAIWQALTAAELILLVCFSQTSSATAAEATCLALREYNLRCLWFKTLWLRLRETGLDKDA